MKKIALSLILLTLSQAVFADPHHGYGPRGYAPPPPPPHVIYRDSYHHDHDEFGETLVPLIIGGTIGYILAQPKQATQQPQTVYRQPTVIQGEPIYQYQTIHDVDCDCDRRVLVRIN